MMKNKNTPLKTAICLSLLGTATTQAAWVWSDWGDANNPTGTSGSTLMTPISANYDPANAVNGLAWDTTPQPFLLNWMSSTPVVLDLAIRPGSTSIEYLEIKPIDPTVTSYDIMIELVFPFHLAVRQDPGTGTGLLGNGGLGFALAPIGVEIDNAQLYSETADGNAITLNTTTAAATGTTTPGQYSLHGGNTIVNATGDTADFGAIGGATGAGFRGLFGDVNNSTHFAWPAIAGDPTDPAKGLGSQKWTLTGVNVDDPSDVIRMSFDGGVPEGAQETAQIPEPTSALLVALGGLGFLARRKRS